MKGISQVITSALILAVAVSVAGVYANWAPGFAQDISERTTNQQQEELRCDNAALNIRNAEYDSSRGFVEITIENTGTINLYGGFNAAALKNSNIIGSTEVDGIEVGEEDTYRIETAESPSKIVMNSNDCSSMDISTTNIDSS